MQVIWFPICLQEFLGLDTPVTKSGTLILALTANILSVKILQARSLKEKNAQTLSY